MGEKVKIAVVGVGNISACHITGYKACDDVELYAFCDINEERLQAAGREHGVTRLYTDINEMLKDLPEIDAVSVCTWNNAHAPCTIAALNAGKHVLCEKPMAMTVEESLAMKEAADKNGKLLMIGFVRRFGHDTEVLQDLSNGGALGELYYAKANYIRRHGCPGGWFCDLSRSGGGPLIDLGVHITDLVRYLMGNPKPVSVYGATFKKLGSRPGCKTRSLFGYEPGPDDVYDTEEFASAMIRFENGAVLQIETSFALNTGGDDGDLQMFGTKAGVRLSGNDIQLFTDINGHLCNTRLYDWGGNDFAKMFNAETRHFVNCVKGIDECRAPAEDGIELMKILRAIYKSAETGHEVVL